MLAVAHRKVEKILTESDIIINGGRDGDPIINDDKVFSMVARSGSLGLGESYMKGYWDCASLDVFFHKLLRNESLRSSSSDRTKISLAGRMAMQLYRRFNPQRRSKAFEVAEQHYDIGNELYEAMLGESMVYTCAYWQNAENVTQAQYAKLDLICRKLRLKPGMRVLDIGCGFGSFAKYAAQNYGVSVLGITVSREQQSYARQFCAGLDVEIELVDYRDLSGKFDAVASVGMFEAVGDKNYDEYMKKVAEVLKDDGLFLLHTIAQNYSSPYPDSWLNKYIFPNGYLPGLRSIAPSIEGHFVMEDLHNIGPNYDLTLMAWHEKFTQNWTRVAHLFDPSFYRMWRYYLLSCAGCFRARHLQLWQILLSKSGIDNGVPSVR